MSETPTISRRIAQGISAFGGERAQQLLPQTRLSGPMPWVIAIMVTLTVIAAAGGLSLSNLASGARAELTGGVTVQILQAQPTERDRQAAAAEAILRDLPNVAGLRRVPDAELDALLEPWLGTGIDADAVPIPALIDVRLDGDAGEPELAEMRVALSDVAPDARVDAQSAWLRPVFAAISSLQWLAIALVILLAVTSSAAVWLASRSQMGGNKETIEIIHLLGGTDGQIARIFQRSIALDAALGGAVGLALGLGAILLLGQQFAELKSGMVDGGGLQLLDWLLIAAIPLAGVAIAVLTARFTVLTALRRML